MQLSFHFFPHWKEELTYYSERKNLCEAVGRSICVSGTACCPEERMRTPLWFGLVWAEMTPAFLDPTPLGSLLKWNPLTHSERNLQAAALCGLQQSIWVEWTTFSACTSLLTVVTNSIKMETGAKMFMLLSVFLCPWHTQAALLYAQHLLRWSLLVWPHLHWWDYLPHIRACGLFV